MRWDETNHRVLSYRSQSPNGTAAIQISGIDGAQTVAINVLKDFPVLCASYEMGRGCFDTEGNLYFDMRLGDPVIKNAPKYMFVGAKLNAGSLTSLQWPVAKSTEPLIDPPADWSHCRRIAGFPDADEQGN
jgi:hypothetical protein